MKTAKQSKKNIYTRLFLSLALILAFIIILFLGFFIWIKNGKLTDTKKVVLKTIPIPLATVNNKLIWSTEFIKEIEINNQFLNKITNQPSQKTAAEILDKILTKEILNQQVKQKNISISKTELENEFVKEETNFSKNEKQTLEEYLTNYGISKNYYKNSIILPELELSNLKKWFYSQRELNEKPYKTADQILKLISEKVSFESLAKTYSLDSSTRVFSGDLGQVNLDELLPEIAVEIKSMNVGDIKIVTSRYGLHIIKLEDKPGEDKYHLRQIFLNGEDFFSWQNTETKKYIIKKFINF